MVLPLMVGAPTLGDHGIMVIRRHMYMEENPGVRQVKSLME